MRRASSRWVDDAGWSWRREPVFGEFDTLTRGISPLAFGDGKFLVFVLALPAVLADLTTIPAGDGERTEVLILSTVLTSLGVVDWRWRRLLLVVAPVRSGSYPFSAGRAPVGNSNGLLSGGNRALIGLGAVPYRDDRRDIFVGLPWVVSLAETLDTGSLGLAG